MKKSITKTYTKTGWRTCYESVAVLHHDIRDSVSTLLYNKKTQAEYDFGVPAVKTRITVIVTVEDV